MDLDVNVDVEREGEGECEVGYHYENPHERCESIAVRQCTALKKVSLII